MKEFLAKMKVQQDIMEKLFDATQAESRDYTDEEKTEYAAAKTEHARLKAAYEEAKELEQNRTDLDNAQANLKPAHTPASNADATANSVTAGDSLKAEKPYENLGSQLIDVATASVNSEAMERLVKNKLNTETGADGGFLVRPEFVGNMLEQADSQSQLFSRAQQITVSGNSASLPAVDETSRADGSRFGGISVDWVKEGGQGNYSQPKFDNLDLKLGKLMGLVAITSEMLDDSDLLASWVQGAFPAEMAFELDQALYNGDGNGKPLGVMNSGALVTVAKEGSQVAETIVYENIVKMWARMPARRAARTAWFVTQQALEQFPLMNLSVGTGGAPVFLPAGGASEAPYSTLMGRPIVPVEQATALGSKGDILLADMSDYVAITKGGVRTDSSIHVEFNKDIQCFRFIRRVNGAPYTRKALASKAKAAFTTSPYITLAERA